MFQRSIQRALLKVRSAREAARRELRFLKEDSQLYAGALKGVRLRHVEVGGLELVVRANEAVGRSLYFRGRFEEWESAFITSQVRRDDVCVDVGANIGYFAVLMASLGAHVHAFDPLTLNVRLVALNAALNGLDVTINQLALSDASGEKQLVESEDSAF
ncbi:MAG: FkbM family methyltransferase, partial [Polyangiaceae bacterium]